MTFREIKRLTELVTEYHWYDDDGMIAFVPYDNCEELFSEICPVVYDHYPDCTACKDYIAVPHFEEFLERYTDEEIEDIFPKEDKI